MANNNWNNYTEKTATPVDADEVMVRDSTDGKNKKLLFGTFWKWVAKKLNEATISELQTENKTVIGALNYLNGNRMLSKASRLDDNINDFFMDSNKYACEYFPVWGTIGGLFSGWAWGIVMVNNSTANFFGIENSGRTSAYAHYTSSTGWEIIK